MTPRAASVHPRSLISSRLDREITPGETRFLDAHLRTCPACQRKEADLKVIVSGLAGLPVAAPPAEAIDRLLIRLRERRHEALGPAPVLSVVPRAEIRKWHRTPWVWLVPAAATISVVVLFYSWGIRMDPGVIPPPPDTFSPVAVAQAPVRPSIDDAVPPPAPMVEVPRPTEEARVADQPAPLLDPEPAAETAQPDPDPLPDAAAPAGTELRDREPDEAVGGLSPIYFKRGSKRLTAEARQLVETVAEFLHQNQAVVLEIQGHTDSQRSIPKSLALGQKRALAVARHLEQLGIDSARLLPVSYGENHPADSGHDDRVEFALQP